MNKKINQFFTKQFPKDNKVDIYKRHQRYDLVLLKIAVPDQEPTELINKTKATEIHLALIHNLGYSNIILIKFFILSAAF